MISLFLQLLPLCQPCPPCPDLKCTEALEIPIDHGYCSPNWVMVANPFAGECKEFAKNVADLCAQCPHNVRYSWCNKPHPRGYESGILQRVDKLLSDLEKSIRDRIGK